MFVDAEAGVRGEERTIGGHAGVDCGVGEPVVGAGVEGGREGEATERLGERGS